MQKWLVIAIVGAVLTLGWRFAPDEPTDLRKVLGIPNHFPIPEIPADNTPTAKRIELGRQLFFDPILSRDTTVSCASCHIQEYAFSDTVAQSKGIAGRMVDRNAPTLANVAYHPRMMRDGGVPSIEMQILVPIQEHKEFDTNLLLLADRLKEHPRYAAMCETAYPGKELYFALTRSIASFERTLISGNSAWDRYQQGERKALSKSAKRGMKLFNSKELQCANCHSGFNFTNYSYQNTGLYVHYPDSGRMRITHEEADRALFKVPTLRNIALTAPYMHDGSLPTLESVIDHYIDGGKAHPNKSPMIRPLELSEADKADLLAFLRALTDEQFCSAPRFKP